MKDAPDTLPPIVGRRARTGGWKQLLFGHTAADAYYEALDGAGRYFLWMEFSRFGTLRAYPCVLAERDLEPLVYRPYGDVGADGGNAALLARWQETAPTAAGLQITELTKDAFQRIYRGYRGGEAG